LVTVAVGELGGVIGEGLLQLLATTRGLEVLGADLGPAALQAAVAEGHARVAVLNEDSVTAPSLPRRLRATQPNVGLVVLAHRPTRAYAARALKLGINVCLATDAPTKEIVRGIRIAAAGKHVFIAMSPRKAPQAARAAGIYALTSREREVLALLSSGHKNAEIAQTLNVSLETTRTHIKHLYNKLGVSSRGELLNHEHHR
jgi:DNA-binding NarL/FixJ family response regulator